MKKAVCILFLLISLISSNLFAADGAPEKENSSVQSKDWNFRFGPLGLLIGLVNLDLDYRINDHFTLGPTLGFWNFKFGDVKIRASAIGVQGRYFITQVYQDSWYGLVKLEASKAKAEITDQGVLYTGEGSGGGLAFGVGYHWFWDNSFNINLGVGANTSNQKIKVKDSLGNAYKDDAQTNGGGFLEFTMGWLF